MIILANLPEPSRLGDVLMSFLSIVFEGAPYILIGTVMSGFIAAFLPSKLLEKVLPKNRVLSTFAAGFMGLVFPVCECAVVPVVRRLVQKGLPLSCAITYLVSAPIINPIVIFSTMSAFQNVEAKTGVLGSAGMAMARVSLGYAIAVLIGLLLLRKKPRDVLAPSVAAGMEKAAAATEEPAPPPFNTRLVQAMRTSMRDFLDTAMYFAVGVVITSVFNTQVDQAKVELVAGSDWTAIPSLMGLSFVLALCSTSDAFIAAPMATFSSAAKLAFLVFGPMLDVKLVFMYAAVFRRKFVIWLCAAMFILVAGLSKPWTLLIDQVQPKAAEAAKVSTP
ncbi:permease [Prosthecobacter sp.]|uniref:permease n=1 Tax=Prosthecobacter sp. TaxID=1965333 RepID=UPI001D8EDE74|nr:permease [Prosthecobacter sp.]MCB1279332.1 permease [Prosthecobacter sp.]